MRIFIDADACPKVVKAILYRAAIRTQTKLILVANRVFKIPVSPFIQIIQVQSGFDEADKRIVADINSGDLVITADIPLADIITDKGGLALNPRGKLYTKKNIKHSLATRNLMEHLRDSQLISGGPPTFSKKDQQELANQLDRILSGGQ